MNRHFTSIRRSRQFLIAVTWGLFLGAVFYAVSASAEPWRFGVMGDTQWKGDADGRNSVATGVIEKLNAEFIAAKVKFVIQVGDLVDQYPSKTSNSMDTRAEAAQPLYAAGIGFFPLRGNHEKQPEAAARFVQDFPQTQGAVNRFGAVNFSSPGQANGLSYAFDYQNARFVLLDQFAAPIKDQQTWIGPILKAKPPGGHAFVFAHKGLITERHKDTLFGKDPADDPEAQNAFMRSLHEAGVRYFFGGHDHLHHRALVKSPNRLFQIHAIVCAGNSFKFYGPAVPPPDLQVNRPPRETPLAQELNTLGYYLVTIDGPRVTVDYYSASPTVDRAPPACGSLTIKKLPENVTFVKKESFGYSLNGRQFLVGQGGSYGVVADRFGSTSARILSGVNGSVFKDGSGRPLCKEITTGWTVRSESAHSDALRSDVFHLWGMNDLGADHTDPFVLQMGYDTRGLTDEELDGGAFGLCTNADGRWILAVEANVGGKKCFVGNRPAVTAGRETLGMYGYDSAAGTVWAVVNYPGRFAAGKKLAAAG
ncbi:MAG: metallophosphoesterase [Pirellulales bacterium]|nr:metallophosphoesterase [Pirellulales bacterium]